MNKHFARFKELLVDRPLEEIENTLEHEGAAQAFKKAAPCLAVGLGAVVLVLALLYAARRTIWNVLVIVVMAGVFWASYLENRKPAVGPATTKAPTMEQYITVGNIVKIAAKRVVPMLGLSQIFEESDIKAAKDERIVPCGKCWLLKYRLLKTNVSTVADESMIQRVLQSELRTVLDNDNPAGFDRVRFVYGGIDECVLQVDHVTQGSLYVYIYVCYASADYFSQREQEQENGKHDTADFCSKYLAEGEESVSIGNLYVQIDPAGLEKFDMRISIRVNNAIMVKNRGIMVRRGPFEPEEIVIYAGKKIGCTVYVNNETNQRTYRCNFGMNAPLRNMKKVFKNRYVDYIVNTLIRAQLTVESKCT